MNILFTADEIAQLTQQHYPNLIVTSCTLIERGFNDNYLVTTKNEKYIFRVYVNGKYFVESHQDFQFELDLLEHLDSHDIPVSTAIRLASGELLGTTDTKLGNRAFALFTYVDGVRIRHGSIFPEQCFQFGKTMAKMHVAANSFRSGHHRYKLDLTYLRDEPLRLIEERKKQTKKNDKEDRFVAEGEHVLKKLEPLESIVETINNVGTTNDEFGIIHADLHFGNMHFLGNNPTIFDFDHCAYGWRAYDLAIAWHMSEPLGKEVLRGYESIRVLSDAEKDSLKAFGMIRNLWDIGDIIATIDVRKLPEE